jgi:hypothetical protein
MTAGSSVAIASSASRSVRLGGALLIAGGVAAVVLWPIFTSVHGPTSYNEDRPFLGRDMLFWGLLLGVIPNVLIAAGSWLGRSVLLRGAGRAARIGYAFVLLGLIVSATLDIAFGGLGPPLLLPVVAVGALILALAPRTDPRPPRAVRIVIFALGILFFGAFLWALVPLETSDSVGGYRIFGFLAHLVGGIGWATLGLLLWRSDEAVQPEAIA